MVQLVCIDVDGTLVGSSGTVQPEVWAAAERARQSGLRLAICSGRPAFGNTREWALRLDAEGWHIFQNGASVLNLATGESLSEPLPPESVVKLVTRARHTGRILELYTDSSYAVESLAERARTHAGLLGVPYERRAFASLMRPVVRAQWLLAHDEVDDVLAEPHAALELSPSTSPVMPDTTFVNMTRKGIDKASAVRALAGAYGVRLDEVMLVGDGENDVKAMGTVGFPVAMANADAGVRRIARHSVGHVDDAGLAEALDLAIASRETRALKVSGAR